MAGLQAERGTVSAMSHTTLRPGRAARQVIASASLLVFLGFALSPSESVANGESHEPHKVARDSLYVDADPEAASTTQSHTVAKDSLYAEADPDPAAAGSVAEDSLQESAVPAMTPAEMAGDDFRVAMSKLDLAEKPSLKIVGKTLEVWLASEPPASLLALANTVSRSNEAEIVFKHAKITVAAVNAFLEKYGSVLRPPGSERSLTLSLSQQMDSILITSASKFSEEEKRQLLDSGLEIEFVVDPARARVAPTTGRYGDVSPFKGGRLVSRV